jgi:hypothetical protein
MIYFFFNLFYRWENVRLDFFNVSDIVQPAKSADHVSDILLPRNRTCLPDNLLHRGKYRTCLLTMIRSDSFYPVVCICCLKELTYFIDGKTFVWIYIFLNICLSTKYLFINKIFEMKNISLNDIFFFNLFYRWENEKVREKESKGNSHVTSGHVISGHFRSSMRNGPIPLIDPPQI